MFFAKDSIFQQHPLARVEATCWRKDRNIHLENFWVLALLFYWWTELSWFGTNRCGHRRSIAIGGHWLAENHPAWRTEWPVLSTLLCVRIKPRYTCYFLCLHNWRLKLSLFIACWYLRDWCPSIYMYTSDVNNCQKYFDIFHTSHDLSLYYLCYW